MRILVAGGRDYIDKNIVYDILDNMIKLSGISCSEFVIIQGGAKGADSLARSWAIDNNVKYETYDADWKQFGKSAGYIRNKQMIIEGAPTAAILFPGGSGTENMRQQCENIILIILR